MPNPPVSTLRQRLVRTFEDPAYRPPPLPNLATQLLALAGREDTNVDDVVRLLETDEMLAASLLRLISSPLYAGRGKITSLREGVIRLGVRTVRDVVFEAALRRGIFEADEYSETIERINRHSTATAHLTRIICRYVRMNEDQAFLSALLHDIGFAALLYTLSNGKTVGHPPLREVWEDLDGIHELASKIVTKAWAVPADISSIVAAHHHVGKGPTARVGAIVQLADHLTERFDAHIRGPVTDEGVTMPGDKVTDVEVLDCLALLSLNPASLDRITADAERLIPQLARAPSPAAATGKPLA